MAKLQFATRNQIFGSVDFRAQDKADRVAVGEALKSIQYVPDNATGEWQQAPISLYYESRGALNAMMDVAFDSYELLEGLHLYRKSNPKHLNGSFGWISRDLVLKGIQNGSTMVNIAMSLNGTVYDVRLPSHKVNGVATLDIRTSWLSAVKLAGNRLELSNAITDKACGRQFGVIKHAYLEDIRKGIALTVAVTKSTIWNAVNPDGTPVVSDALQTKAIEFRRLVKLAETKGFTEAQQEYFLTKAAVASNADNKGETAAFLASNPTTPEKVAELNNTKVLMIANGTETSVPVSELPVGWYKVVARIDGKTNMNAVKANMFNTKMSSALSLARRENFQIAFVLVKLASA
jgi:hypothetical protein